MVSETNDVMLWEFLNLSCDPAITEKEATELAQQYYEKVMAKTDVFFDPFKKIAGQRLILLLQYFPNLPYQYDESQHYWNKRFIKTDKKIGFNVFNDGIDYTTPSFAGLYFVGETHFNPITKEEFYWVKIGKAKNLAERMKQYNTCNPMMYRIGFSKEYDKELEYQNLLLNKSIARCNHNNEWFLVDRNTYLEMCEKGFSYFN